MIHCSPTALDLRWPYVEAVGLGAEGESNYEVEGGQHVDNEH